MLSFLRRAVRRERRAGRTAPRWSSRACASFARIEEVLAAPHLAKAWDIFLNGAFVLQPAVKLTSHLLHWTRVVAPPSLLLFRPLLIGDTLDQHSNRSTGHHLRHRAAAAMVKFFMHSFIKITYIGCGIHLLIYLVSREIYLPVSRSDLQYNVYGCRSTLRIKIFFPPSNATSKLILI